MPEVICNGGAMMNNAYLCKLGGRVLLVHRCECVGGRLDHELHERRRARQHGLELVRRVTGEGLGVRVRLPKRRHRNVHRGGGSDRVAVRVEAVDCEQQVLVNW